MQSEAVILKVYGESWATPDISGGHGKAIHCPRENFNDFIRLVREGRKNPQEFPRLSVSESGGETDKDTTNRIS